MELEKKIETQEEIRVEINQWTIRLMTKLRPRPLRLQQLLR